MSVRTGMIFLSYRIVQTKKQWRTTKKHSNMQKEIKKKHTKKQQQQK